MKSVHKFFEVLVGVVVILLSLNQVSLAKDALYIVPTEPEFVDFSRFNIEIVNAYENGNTEKIAYKFPEILVGQKDKVLEFNRIPGTSNSWHSPEADAHCNVLGDLFSCNIHLNKSFVPDVIGSDVVIPNRLSKDFALEQLKNMTMPQAEMQGFSHVIEAFFAGEPAGILMYEI